jgi:hypothetical protein
VGGLRSDYERRRRNKYITRNATKHANNKRNKPLRQNNAIKFTHTYLKN